jgi:hypothetical protein
MSIQTVQVVLSAVCGLVLLAEPPVALAGNDDEVPIGNQAAMSGGAVTATASDGAAAWYNPAGVAAVTQDTVDVSGSVFSIRHYRMGEFLSASTGDHADARTTELVTIPSALTLVRPVSERVNVSLGVFVPRTVDIRVRDTLFTYGPESTWILDLASKTQAYHAGGTIAVRAHDTVRVGFTLGGIYTTQSARGEFFGEVVGPDGATGIFGLTIDASVWTVGLEAALGLQWDPTPALSLGLSVRSPSLEIYSSSEADIVTTSAMAGGMSTPGADLVLESAAVDGIERASLYPPRVRAGVAWRFSRGWVALDGDFQPAWSDDTFQTEREPVWNVRVGGTVRVSDDVALGAGFFSDRASDPDPADLTDTRADFYGGSFGITFDNTHGLAEDEEAETITFSSTVALRYAYGSGEVGSLFVDFADPAREIVKVRVTDYTVHEIGLHVGSALYF